MGIFKISVTIDMSEHGGVKLSIVRLATDYFTNGNNLLIYAGN